MSFYKFIFEDLKKTVTLMSSIKEIFDAFNKGLIKDPNCKYITSNIVTRVGCKEDSKIDEYLKTIKLETHHLAQDQLHALHEEYLTIAWFVHSRRSEAMWNLKEGKDDDVKRAAMVMDFMCDTKNWELGSCAFLWKKFLSGKLFVAAPAHASSPKEEKQEKMELRPTP